MILRKLIALLLFIFGLFLLFFLFLFFFINFEGSVKINSNIENYNVIINSTKTAFNTSETCEQLECQIDSIPVGEIRILISKEGYNDVIKEVIIDKNNIINLDVELKKLSSLILEEDNQEISSKLKVIHLKYKDELEKNPNQIEEKESIIAFEKEGDFFKVVEYTIKEKKLLAEINIKGLSTDNMFFQKVENTSNQYFFNLENNIYIIGENIETKEFKFKPKINYIKFEIEDSSYIIISDSGAFVLNKDSNNLVYNTKFDDFVLLDKNYIGYIKSNSQDKLEDFDLDNNNYIVSYNPKTLEKNVVLEPKINIERIIKENNNIYAIDEEDNKYKLELNN